MSLLSKVPNQEVKHGEGMVSTRAYTSVCTWLFCSVAWYMIFLHCLAISAEQHSCSLSSAVPPSLVGWAQVGSHPSICCAS